MRRFQFKNSAVMLLGAALILSLSNCGKTEDEIIEDITPVMTAKVDGETWSTKIAAGVNSTLFIISGTKDKELITLKIPTKAIGVYPIDGLNNFAFYTPESDSISDSYIAYKGTIDLKSMNTIRTQVNGTFEFTAVNANSDTIYISEGIFKNIPTK